MRLSRLAGVLGAAACLAACADILGIPDREIDPGDGGASVDATSADNTTDTVSRDGTLAIDTGAGDATDAAPASDAFADGGADAALDAIDEADASDAGPTTCALVDCSNPACLDAGYACSPAAPPGWTVIAFAAASRPACPTGYGAAALLVEGPDAGGNACACTCGAPSGDPCAQGDLTFDLGHTGCGFTSYNVTSDGGCDPIPGGPVNDGTGPPWDNRSTPLAASLVACSATTTLPALTFASQGRACMAIVDAGVGCSAGACLPYVAPGSWCIEAPGTPACPGGFTTRHVEYTANAVADTRACTPTCACQSNATSCSGARATLYGDSTCSTPLAVVPIDGGCNDLPASPNNASHFVYTATPDTPACAAQGASTVTGGVDAGAPMTICCP